MTLAPWQLRAHNADQSMYLLSSHANRNLFPPVDQATPEGLLAIGGDLSSDRILAAYRHGIFPWYSEGQPILWWSPDPRAVLYPDDLKISRSLARTIKKGAYRVTFDRAFNAVIRGCAAPRHKDPDGGTWITQDMVNAYSRLHEQGYAHSVETWRNGQLVGGLYGLALGRGFFGESMYSRATDASKVALVALVERLKQLEYDFIDCQLPSRHILSLGAIEVPREHFLSALRRTLEYPDSTGPWSDTSPVGEQQVTAQPPCANSA